MNIPFIVKETQPRSVSEIETRRPGALESISDAIVALQEDNPSQALSLIAPWQDDDHAPAQITLVAGRVLTALGRYSEAIDCFEEYLAFDPNSVEGHLAAGFAAACDRQLNRAMDLFNRAANLLVGRAHDFLEPLISRDVGDKNDPVALEEMIIDAESNPEDKDRALALACALGQAGHFRAVERFLPITN